MLESNSAVLDINIVFSMWKSTKWGDINVGFSIFDNSDSKNLQTQTIVIIKNEALR